MHVPKLPPTGDAPAGIADTPSATAAIIAAPIIFFMASSIVTFAG